MHNFKFWFHFNKVKTLAIVILSIASYAHSAVNLEKTRIVFNNPNKPESLKLVNSSDKPSLVQVWTDQGDLFKSPDKIRTPIIVTPPIFKINPQEIKSLQIIMTSLKELPKDRESIYWLNILQIPPKETSTNLTDEQKLIFTLRMRIKIFVRPSSINEPDEKEGNKLAFKVNNGQVMIHNPTPWHMTLVNIRSQQTHLEDTMVKPFSTESVKIPAGETFSGNFEYELVNDFGHHWQYKQTL